MRALLELERAILQDENESRCCMLRDVTFEHLEESESETRAREPFRTAMGISKPGLILFILSFMYKLPK